MKNLENAAHNIRCNILHRACAAGANGAHIAPALSIVEILSVLFLNVMNYDVNDPHNKKRDRFILSKGHGALACYAAMYESKIISEEAFLTYEQNGGFFPGQPSKNIDYGIEYSGGSLGLGLSYAIGLAMSDECKENKFNVYVLLGDGELNEGSVWESAMFAGHHKISNITAIVDKNSMQSDGFTRDILTFDIASMWASCGWNVIECDGHNLESLSNAFSKRIERPTVIIADTVKGKGVSFMENSREWHHSRLTQGQLDKALGELCWGGCKNGI